MFEKFQSILEKAQAGTLSQDRDCVEACLPHVFFATMDVFMSRGKQGAERLSLELDRLAVHAMNKHDPVWRGVDVLTQKAVWAMLNGFTQQKETLHAATKALEDAADSPRLDAHPAGGAGSGTAGA